MRGQWLFRLIGISCALPLLLGASKPTLFQIKGVQGPLLVNIQHRLAELEQSKQLDDASAENLRAQIIQAMSPYGFFKPSIEISAPSSTHRLWQIHIQQGPVMKIHALSIRITGEGENNPTIQEALHTLPLHVGEPFHTLAYEESKSNLLFAAEQQGYLHATFDKAEALLDTALNAALITLHFNTGPRSYFGEIQFNTQGILSNDLLYRYVPFKYGEPYSTDQLTALNTNLASSGYFRAVNVKPTDDTTLNHVPIMIHLEPVNRTNYSLGVGYGTDTGPRGRAGLHVVPVNPHGDQFNVVAQGSWTESALQMQYVIPGTDPVHDHYNITGGISNLNYSSGYSTAELGSFVQQHIQNDFQRNLSINALHERFNYTSLPKTEQNVFYPKANAVWRHVSDTLFSPSGYNIALNGLVSSHALLSNISIAQASIDAKVAISLAPIRTRLYLHAIQGVTQVNNIYDLPLSLALLLGGAENMKGSSFNAIGPGKVLSYGGMELQKETFDTWYLLAFIDAGDVYQPRPLTFQYDAGVGIMWRSPVGPIKIAVAQPTNVHLQRRHGYGPRLVINMGPDL